jgi:hypothetical protein
MNARPLRRFLFRLAGHLGMTVREIETRMDSRELSEWIALDRYYEPLGDTWLQTGYQIAASLAPYSKRKLDPRDFVPTAGKAPMHQTQIDDQLKMLQADLEGLE